MCTFEIYILLLCRLHCSGCLAILLSLLFSQGPRQSHLVNFYDLLVINHSAA